MQLNVVSDDPCSENVVSTELNGVPDVPVDETLVQEEGLRGKRESEGMKVDYVYVGDGNWKAVSEHLSDRGEASGLKGEIGYVNDACVKKEGKDLGKNFVAVEGVINQDNPIKANINSFAQQFFLSPVNVDRSGKEVEAKKTVENRSVEVKSQAATSEKEDCGVDDDGGGFSNHKGVSLVVDLDKCIRNDKKKGKKKGGFCASDLVWGKVKSHPWWPAQIFESGDASEKSRKYFNSKGYFVGYFGDQTFAWNDETKLKPFAPNFSQMVKQTRMDAFRHAVDCILVETSRRVEFGLSCHCIVDEVYNQLKTQVVENAGILEQSRVREGGDRFFTASSFQPVKFLDYVNDLAQGPHADVDRLEHVIARAQMAAFYRWKGIYHLAEFGSLIGYVNNEADAPVTADKEKCEVIADGNLPPITIEEDDIRPQKRKKTSSDGGQSTKKARCFSDLIGKKGLQKKDDKETKGKSGSKPISPSARRRKEIKTTKECSPLETSIQFKDTKPSYKVGESILRVAGQLSQPSPLLKLDLASHGKKDKGNSKQCSKITSKYASLDVILSELHLAAIEPLKELSLLSKMVTFISDFRNSIVPDSELLQKHEESGKEGTSSSDKEGLYESGPAEICKEEYSSATKSKSKAPESEITTLSDVEAGEDVKLSNKTIKVLEQQTSLSDVKLPVVEPDHSEVDGISVCSQEIGSTVSSSQQHCGSENGTSEGGQVDEKMQQEDSPTALTLKFTDMDSMPTETKLINVFSHFGSLKESETEVVAKKLCARVVFKRRSDAETAFSSSGKFKIFGPSLVCYRLNYAPSPRKSPCKSPSVDAKRRKKD
ncbi:hypothetical protein SOVF_016280 [Spinacia oleracea]|uniref:PWWP domain-containing protein 5 n=1 Tax=Spinacia oleracea TaxID=3562 RepID=A0A9R0KB37_SPIOL|nr:PWWP domain-containing protein 5-like [Spinacia oleracea]KNA24385.1 hypothetical protein SOVF_016280 [Spinacia oleracea]